MSDCDPLPRAPGTHMVLLFSYYVSQWMGCLIKILNLVMHFLECVNESDFKICVGKLRNLDSVQTCFHCLVFLSKSFHA